MLKNKFVSLRSIIISFVSVTIAFCLSIYLINNYRYNIDTPMQDIEYKKEIIKQSYNPFFRLENLRNLVGEKELTEFIKANDLNPDIYASSTKNRANGLYRATLHMHTTNSDGQSTVEQYLDIAQRYAEKFIKDGDYFYIAITDHNTVLGAKELIKVLQKAAKKYPKVKVIAGIEVNSKLYSTTTANEPVEIHTLVWCINPYDKDLNKIFYKKNLKDKWNIPEHEPDFEWLVKKMSDYGIPGIAHPATYSDHLGDRKNAHIDELFDKYKANTKKIPFAEGFYQTYPSKYYEKNNEFSDYYAYIKNTAKSKGIIRTGSQDSHGLTLFKRF